MLGYLCPCIIFLLYLVLQIRRMLQICGEGLACYKDTVPMKDCDKILMDVFNSSQVWMTC